MDGRSKCGPGPEPFAACSARISTDSIVPHLLSARTPLAGRLLQARCDRTAPSLASCAQPDRPGLSELISEAAAPSGRPTWQRAPPPHAAAPAARHTRGRCFLPTQPPCMDPARAPGAPTCLPAACPRLAGPAFTEWGRPRPPTARSGRCRRPQCGRRRRLSPAPPLCCSPSPPGTAATAAGHRAWPPGAGGAGPGAGAFAAPPQQPRGPAPAAVPA